MKKTSFFFSVNTQFENLGDALINRELILEASKFGEVKVDVSRCPESFVETLGLSPNTLVHSKKIEVFRGIIYLILKVIVSRVKGRDVFYFLNPGGLGRPRSNKQRVSAMIYNMLLLFYVLVGVRVCHVGISHEKSGVLDLLISKIRAKLTSHFYVRDQGSFNYLKSNGFDVRGTFPDLAFYLYGRRLEVGEGAQPVVGFSFRLDGKNVTSEESIKTFILSVFDKYKEKGEYAFISQVKRDDQPMIKMAEWFYLETGLKASIQCCSGNVDSMVSFYSSCHTVYSNRLHVLLLSGFSGAVPVAVIDFELNKKVLDLYLDVGMKDFIVNIKLSNKYTFKHDKNLLNECMKAQYQSLENMFPEILSIEPS